MRDRGNKERKATAAVELGFLLPILVFLFVVAVDYARVFYYTQVIENCARQGALYASDPKAPAANLYTSVKNAALADAKNLTPQPTVTSTTGTDKTGNAYVAVTVTWQFNTLTGFPGIPNTVTISRTVQMRLAP
jgi:Flp pilus assembly protein TadG